TVSQWVTLPHTMAYYGANGGGVDGNDVRDKEMIEDAIAALEDDGFDFAPFDVDGDEWIDSFSVIHQGRGEEAGGSPDTIWSHAGAINPVKVDGIWIGRYHTEPEIHGSELTTIGVICHEFGHILGLPDLYDTDQSSSGIGKWAIMSTGCWNNSGRRPAHFCSWSKIKLGWISPTVLYSSRDTININKLSANPQAYKINSGMASNEYLLLENRQRTGNTFDDSLPYAGLLVYHIDDNRANNNDETHYMVGLLQADGRWDLENNTNRGDSGDPFPGSTNNRQLGPNTIPNTNSYYNGRTDIGIGNISLPADTMSFSLSLSNGYVIYVDANATEGEKNGASWKDAFLYLQDALEFASALNDDICEIRVAGGIYTPDKNSAQHYGSSDRQATFRLINAIVIKGGYAGLAAPNPAERDPNKYQTILSGDLAGNDIAVSDVTELLDEPTRAENSIHVITGSNTNETAVLEGLTITGGRADDSYPHNSGSAMYNNSGSPKLINCTFIHNSAPQGNCMFNLSDSNPTLINCTFTRNYGGGICNSDRSSPTLANCRFIEEYNGGLRNYDNSNPTLTDCKLTDNSADTFGGGMYNLDSNPKLINCKFINNGANGGGAIFNSGNSNVKLNNCIFVGNAALNSGGAIWNIMQANATLTNCVFNRNSAGSNGGGLYNASPGVVTLSNCILWDNINGQIEGTAYVSYSAVQGGWTGLGNINADPFFADANNGDYHLKSQVGRWDAGSQSWVRDNVTSPCIDAGNPGCPIGNEPAPAGSRKNMGAYGGTAQASKSPENWRSLADLTNDWIVDSNDLKAFVGFWLRKGQCIPGDLNRDRSVDFKDSTIFSTEWMEKRPGPTIYYHIAPCIPPSSTTQPRFSVTVDTPYILFYDLMQANCCPDEIELQMTVDNHVITIYETEHTSTPCPCICDYPITATLGPFQPGTYTFYVYQDGNFIGMTSAYISTAE
ncbi:M6 family metalloprotease domain-containing protein, partial [Candidatus Saccharibacteria bacterium]|nr:M6 family metalloprotease domain-containing protein [Candidatus Saccharibacteria bacterium]NIW80526.1 M6 family metalloprotease domain-containing protein [Calditrichia bacterium]